VCGGLTCCRQPLTPDMLQPEVALKARIDGWLAEQRARKMQP
jgi:hypothetical protein